MTAHSRILNEDLIPLQAASLRISKAGGILLGSLFLVNLGIDYFFENRLPTLGTYRLLVGITILFLANRVAQSRGYRPAAHLIMGAFYLLFIAYPLLPYYRDLEEDLFLLMFLSLVISIMPYLTFHIRKDLKYILGWSILTIATSLASFAGILSALQHDTFYQLPQVMEEQPMVAIGYFSCLVFLQVAFYHFKMMVEKQQEEIAARNYLLEQHQEEITAQRDNLEELNQVKDRIFSIIAHDLRSPVNSLQSILAFFQGDGDLPPTQFRDLINKVGVRVQGVNTLLNNLLYWAMSQMEAEVKMKPAAYSLEPYFQELKTIFHEVAQDKQITLTAEVADDLPQLYCDGDALRLVLRNLVANALKYTHPGGSVVVMARAHAQYLRIMVRDTGVGMEEEQRKKLLQDAQTNSTLGTKNEKGTGLGLMITKEFLQRNQGALGIDSVAGEGSTFWFTLPLAEAIPQAVSA